MQHKANRDISLDFVKGILAILMVLSHVGTALRGDNPINPWLGPVLSFIDIITFTSLFFLSGAGLYLATLRHDISEEEFALVKPKLFKKALKILAGYYFLAIISDFSNIFASAGSVLSGLLQILLFYKIPEYTEYLLAFVLLYLVVILFRRLLKIIANKFWLTLLASVLCYLLGYVLFNYPFPAEFDNLKLLLAGIQDRYSFPLLQYLPVFLFGAYWADINLHKIIAIPVSRLVSSSLATVFLSIFIIIQIITTGTVSIYNRWPPDPLFLSIGVVFVTLLLFLFKNIKWEGFVVVIGQNIFSFFVFHLLIIFLAKALVPIQYGLSNEWIILFVFVLVTLVSYFFSSLVNSHRLALKVKHLLDKTIIDELLIRSSIILLIIGLVALALWKIIPPKITTVEQNPDSFDPHIAGLISEQVNLTATVDRKWILKVGENSKYDNYRSGIINIDVTDAGFGYWGVDILIDGQITKALPFNKINVYNYAINANDLSVGTHKIQARLTGTDKTTPATEVIVSEPLYVTWTLDWEGGDISDANMRALDKISKDYQIPIVQLVTPRVFIAGDVVEARKTALLKWIADRTIKGDEIGMHLHMHLDLWEYCGMTPKNAPKWDGRANGHDVLTSAYTPDEFDKLVKCSLKFFEENKIPKPVTYRAGGWFIDLKNLKVLPKNGFLYDTSGREKYTWGLATGFWDLPVTAKPYMISNTDQNKADAENNFGLLEIPNNGLDSTNNSAKVLISKFDANYPDKGQPLKEKQILTYMSHPHWIVSIDRPTLVELYNNLKPYTANEDSGPIVYTTIKDIYNNNVND